MKLLILLVVLPLVMGGGNFEDMWAKFSDKGGDADRDMGDWMGDKGEKDGDGKDGKDKWFKDDDDDDDDDKDSGKSAYKAYILKQMSDFKKYVKVSQLKEMQEKRDKMALFQQMQSIKTRMMEVEQLDNISEDFEKKQKMIKQAILYQFSKFCDCGDKAEVIMRVKSGKFGRDGEDDDEEEKPEGQQDEQQQEENNGEDQKFSAMKLDDLAAWMARLEPKERKKEILKDFYSVSCGAIKQFLDYLQEVENKVKEIRQEKEKDDQTPPCGDDWMGCQQQ